MKIFITSFLGFERQQRFVHQNVCDEPNPYDSKKYDANHPAVTDNYVVLDEFYEKYKEDREKVFENAQADFLNLSAEICAGSGYLYGFVYQIFSGEEFSFKTVSKDKKKLHHKKVMRVLEYLESGDVSPRVSINKFAKGDNVSFVTEGDTTYMQCTNASGSEVWKKAVPANIIIPPPVPPIDPEVLPTTETLDNSTRSINFEGGAKSISVNYTLNKQNGVIVSSTINSTVRELPVIDGYARIVTNQKIIYTHESNDHTVTITINPNTGLPETVETLRNTKIDLQEKEDLENLTEKNTDQKVGAYEFAFTTSVNGEKEHKPVKKVQDLPNVFPADRVVYIKKTADQSEAEVIGDENLKEFSSTGDLSMVHLTKTTGSGSNTSTENVYLMVSEDGKQVYKYNDTNADSKYFEPVDEFYVNDGGKLEHGEIQTDQVNTMEQKIFFGIGASRSEINSKFNFKVSKRGDEVLSISGINDTEINGYDVEYQTGNNKQIKLTKTNPNGTEEVVLASVKLNDGKISIQNINTTLHKVSVSNRPLKDQNGTEITKITINKGASITYNNDRSATDKKESIILFPNNMNIEGITGILRVSTPNGTKISFTKNNNRYVVKVTINDAGDGLNFGAATVETIEAEKLKVTSPSWPDGGVIPDEYARDNTASGGMPGDYPNRKNKVPQIVLSDIPTDHKYVSFIIHDTREGVHHPVHAAYYNIPRADINKLNTTSWKNDLDAYRKKEYIGPYPPATGPLSGPHTYKIQVTSSEEKTDVPFNAKNDIGKEDWVSTVGSTFETKEIEFSMPETITINSMFPGSKKTLTGQELDAHISLPVGIRGIPVTIDKKQDTDVFKQYSIDFPNPTLPGTDFPIQGHADIVVFEKDAQYKITEFKENGSKTNWTNTINSASVAFAGPYIHNYASNGVENKELQGDAIINGVYQSAPTTTIPNPDSTKDGLVVIKNDGSMVFGPKKEVLTKLNATDLSNLATKGTVKTAYHQMLVASSSMTNLGKYFFHASNTSAALKAEMKPPKNYSLLVNLPRGRQALVKMHAVSPAVMFETLRNLGATDVIYNDRNGDTKSDKYGTVLPDDTTWETGGYMTVK
jgi:phosphatidylethanolamine-binding protein (PEBP) family uncharacterized protein